MLPFLRAEIETANKHFGHKSRQKHPMLLQKACREWLSNAESLAAILASENHIFFHRPILIPPRVFFGGGPANTCVSTAGAQGIVGVERGKEKKVISSHPAPDKASILWCGSIRRETC